MKTVVLAIDGVLAARPENDSFAASQPTPEGKELYVAFSSIFRVALHHPDLSEKAKVDHWLRRQGFAGYTGIHYGPVNEALMTVRLAGAPGLWVTSDPEEARQLAYAGVPLMMYVQPPYARNEHRPDEVKLGPNPWGALVDEVDRQYEQMAEDARLAIEDQRFTQ